MHLGQQPIWHDHAGQGRYRLFSPV